MNIDAKKNDLTKDEILDILAKKKVSVKVYNTYDVTLQKDRWDNMNLKESKSEKKLFCFCKKSLSTFNC